MTDYAISFLMQHRESIRETIQAYERYPDDVRHADYWRDRLASVEAALVKLGVKPVPRRVIGRCETMVNGCAMSSSPIFNDTNPDAEVRDAARMAAIYEDIEGNAGRVRTAWMLYTDDGLVEVPTITDVFARARWPW